MVKLGNDWDKALEKELSAEYFNNIIGFLNKEYKAHTCYPAPELVFNALRTTPLEKVKAVILGQDPYHNPGQAHGLCFSVQNGVEPPPSLKNIYEELNKDIGMPIPQTGNLTPWAQQGVLLLNTILSVRQNSPMSHSTIGWQQFTDAVIKALNQRSQPMVFLLWGSPARKKKELITNPNHLILEAPHPSPLSAYRGFFGCKHFSKTNEFLVANGLEPINWQL
jgi:uracil-DNA glycosylase